MSSKITTSHISLPKGGGAIQGMGETFAQHEFTGTFSFSLPIHLTPGRGCFPELQLAYSSGEGNGIFGLGFSLSLPLLSRKTAKGINDCISLHIMPIIYISKKIDE
ncbi:SpvB/TcaC N-terminal domain-containing protein [Brevibacillus agri]|uniref:SpvB/TcaC N-terminal domain-containing protein n=2 Tax=Brevibacillus agri TaxID=51101 RepID=UPI0009E093ED|nr:SpvB/TcaC N-terminal domain-containing protein [Brevibacillus agri]